MNQQTLFCPTLADAFAQVAMAFPEQDAAPGQILRFSTNGKPTDKAGWLKVFPDGVGAVFGCNREGTSFVWQERDKDAPTPSRLERAQAHQIAQEARQQANAEQARQRAEKGAKLIKLWNSTAALTGSDPASLYLKSRGLAVPTAAALRYHGGLDYWHEGKHIGKFPAMLAGVTSPDGKPVTIHRTFLTPDGRKATVPTVKKLCPTAGAMAGASIKIGAPQVRPCGGLGLGVAEGIETALGASMLFGVPVWAAVSASGLESFVPPSNARNIYIFADNDESGAGQEAAKNLAERLNRFTVRIHTPSVVGDWADELAALEVSA